MKNLLEELKTYLNWQRKERLSLKIVYWDYSGWETEKKKGGGNKSIIYNLPSEIYGMYVHSNICICISNVYAKWELQKKRWEKRVKNIWENNCWYCPNLVKNINLHIQESQKTPSSINLDRSIFSHIMKLIN